MRAWLDVPSSVGIHTGFLGPQAGLEVDRACGPQQGYLVAFESLAELVDQVSILAIASALPSSLVGPGSTADQVTLVGMTSHLKSSDFQGGVAQR